MALASLTPLAARNFLACVSDEAASLIMANLDPEMASMVLQSTTSAVCGSCGAATPAKMSQLVGVWDLVSSENWDEYLKEIGVGMVMRKTAGSIRPTVTLENFGDQWNMKVRFSLKSAELSYWTVGVQFEESN